MTPVLRDVYAHCRIRPLASELQQEEEFHMFGLQPHVEACFEVSSETVVVTSGVGVCRVCSAV